ncbi:MAG: aminomethyl-transferring glycine dehydrogenase subunit GcvPB [Kiritimatiellae bacterium]|jgi:glycine dehydrogenase subunit 2|nr:aminomethyl-transferring glycine dehydrogenase subunit GcvPB [Kiritimatiellia bacterium]NLD90837.1 aminomethyl-transferring glycine dehydrogenase subunit GcvPB [Lentisphaerota bacterium]HOU22158.1 aminomethyl-transferring glycine dehydrogenase subunit GcvPB [Kiritimatiellia bacterium]HQN79526.1 aminomethyl-transferring glycine dehydrogenase subunit GcvPB [Kiritimatiellia bacterium]
MTSSEKLSIEKSVPGRRGIWFAKASRPAADWLPHHVLRRVPPRLPEMAESEVVRHYTRLSQLNYCLDTHFYPLGSCTMKHNPRANEEVAALEGFAAAHPCAPETAVQGTLEVLFRLERLLCELTGLAAFTLQPAAGAHGEFTGILVAAAFHRARGDRKRKEILVADSSHGTNPASAALGGFAVRTVASRADGRLDLDALRMALGPQTAMVMLTVPNTLGLFERQIREIAEATHAVGALLYMDGANFNALMGLAKPADFGVDILHLNLHKSFSTPHGGGGPGSGPVGVQARLAKFLPVPRVVEKNGRFKLQTRCPGSIGRMRSFAGNVGVILKAYAYLRGHDALRLRSVAENAILNANYVRARLKDLYPAAVDEPCLHECVLRTEPEKMNGLKTLDVAKRLLDHGFHAPTIYFPLIVHEALMIEPTETETRETLEAFVSALRAIHAEALSDPEKVKTAPHDLPVRRLDELAAARNPNVAWG